MSVESLAIALHHSHAKGAAKLVLIGIANHDGDGGAWPSVATLAKYARVTERNVQKAIKELEGLGEIRRLISEGGLHSTASHLRPNLYKFLLTCPPDCDRSTNHRRRHEPKPVDLFTGVSQATPGVAGDRGGVSQTTPEPSMNQTTNYPEETRVIARTTSGREPLCSMRRNQPHIYEDSGYCRHCGEKRSVSSTTYEIGEVA